MFKHGYQRFIIHYREKGFLYAIYRGLKYILFLFKKHLPIRNMLFQKRLANNAISFGKLKLVFDVCGIKIYWDNMELTNNVGLNIAMATLGVWTDSSRGDWSVLKKDRCSMLIQNRWHYLPITLIWHLQIVNERKIHWRVELEAEEDIKIDKIRAIILLNYEYKTWLTSDIKAQFFSSKQDGVLSNHDFSVPWLGAYPHEDKNYYPGIIFQFLVRAKTLHPLAQRLKIKDTFVHLLGIDISNDANDSYYLLGKYEFISGEIDVIEGSDFKTFIEDLRDLKNKRSCKEYRLKKEKYLKILLLNLPWQKGGKWGARAGSRWPHIKDDPEEGSYLPFPFFLAYSTSLLRKHDFQAYLIDAIAEKIIEDKLLDCIHQIAPDLLVVETSTPSLNYDLALLEKIGNKNFKIALCGPDMNIRNPEFLKTHKFINYVLFGEYEYTLLNLVKNLSHNKWLKDVNGLIYRDGYDVNVNPPAQLVDLDTLPWPLREGLPMHKYLDTPGSIPLPSVQMLASRGCPFGCNFCLWPQVMYHGNKYRARNIADVIDEMGFLVIKMGFKSVYFDDDTFNVGKERMLKFCQEIKSRGLEKIPWAIMARADLMDEEILTQMKKAGLTAIKYGVESASQKLLNNCGKNMDLKKAEEMILFTKSLDIKTHLTFTFGLPGETRSTIQKTMDYVLKLRPHSVQFSITTPFPGTNYYHQLDKKGFIVNKNWDDYDGNFKSVIKLDSLSSKDLELARHTACQLWNELPTESDSLKGYWMRFRESYKRGGLKFSLNKAFSYIRKKNIGYLIHKIKDNYLDMLGIFNGKYAFKGPNTIQIDLTDYCNNNCIGCWCNSPFLSKERLNKPKDMLPAKLVKDLITETFQMGTRDIYFSGGGEPFMHPDILDIIQHAKKLGIACTINTNFTLIDEEIIRKLIDLRLDYLTISVWAGTADIYKALHPNKQEKDFYRIWNMLHFLNSKKDLYPYVKIYNVICNMNYHQIKQMIDFARQTKSEFVEFTVIDTIPNATDKLILSEEQRKIVLEQINEIKERISDLRNNHKPQVINFEHFLRRVSNLDAKQAQYDSQFIDSMPCYVGWLFARIMPNGDVNSCLKSHRFPVGNLHRRSFKKIWNSKKQVYFRKKTLSTRKDDPFFTLIGNDPNCKIGCYKSCDDISRNISMHNKIQILSGYEKYILKILGKTGLGKLIVIPIR